MAGKSGPSVIMQYFCWEYFCEKGDNLLTCLSCHNGGRGASLSNGRMGTPVGGQVCKEWGENEYMGIQNPALENGQVCK